MQTVISVLSTHPLTWIRMPTADVVAFFNNNKLMSSTTSNEGKLVVSASLLLKPFKPKDDLALLERIISGPGSWDPTTFHTIDILFLPAWTVTCLPTKAEILALSSHSIA